MIRLTSKSTNHSCASTAEFPKVKVGARKIFWEYHIKGDFQSSCCVAFDYLDQLDFRRFLQLAQLVLDPLHSYQLQVDRSDVRLALLNQDSPVEVFCEWAHRRVYHARHSELHLRLSALLSCDQLVGGNPEVLRPRELVVVRLDTVKALIRHLHEEGLDLPDRQPVHEGELDLDLVGDRNVNPYVGFDDLPVLVRLEREFEREGVLFLQSGVMAADTWLYLW